MNTTKPRPLYLGCTKARHARLGVNAIVNARAGMQHLNDVSIEDTEMLRDAHSIRDRIESRVRFYQFNSKFFRRNQTRLAHLLSDRNE